MRRKPNTLVIEGDIACIDVSTPKCPDAVAFLDVDDVWLISTSPTRWYAFKSGRHRTPYVARNIKQRTELLHCALLNPEDGQLCDHVNKNGLDNRRANLRLVTHSENMRNRQSDRGASSCYLGVSWCERDKCWRAQRTLNGIRHCLGSFESEMDAARAYDAACTNDPFANLNFPESRK